MKAALIAVLVLSAAVTGPIARAQAPLTIAGFDERETAIYINGVAHGIALTNAQLLFDGLPRLYCPPTSIGAQTMWEIAAATLHGEHGPAAVVTAILRGLKARYPCPRGG